MLKIRFSKKGKKTQPFYRVVISENKRDTQANFLELLGTYNPVTKLSSLKTDRIKYWISVGAQPSNSVFNLLMKESVIETGKKKKSVSITKKRAGKIAEKNKKEEAPVAKAEGEKIPEKQKTEEHPVEEKTAEPQTDVKQPEAPAEPVATEEPKA